MKTTFLLPVLVLAASLTAQDAPTANQDVLPVKELTAFKDGHAYVLREAPLKKDASGIVLLDELPTPVLGTFWPYATGGATLVAAKSGQKEVTVQLPATSLLQLAKANVGKVVTLEVGKDDVIHGELLAIPERDSEGTVLVVATKNGTRAVPIGRVQDLTVKGDFVDTVAEKQMRQRMELRVTGGGDEAKIGVIYVQKGFRWIPSYHIEIDGEGKAKVKMQATLVNDLIDLEDATVNLVVGVPKFVFADMLDPFAIQDALQNQAAQLAMAQGYNQAARFSNYLSNSLMTQTAGYMREGQQEQPSDPKVEQGETSEDLYVFPVSKVTLKKGERMIVPITSFELPYSDIYRYESSMAPPMEHRRNLQDQQVIELARQLAAPKVRHVLRLQNDQDMPLTTAPALVLRNGRILAQGHMMYTPRGATTDLEINTAIDVRVETEEHETAREGNVRMGRDNYSRIELSGVITLSNQKSAPVVIEVVRRVLGHVEEVDHDGKMMQLDLVKAWSDEARPEWWSWWSWPYWWFQHNGFGECRWNVTLKPGEKVELGAKWHYFWR